ncbi:hypothetical protein [Nocardioides sp.]|uniref:hypothetical protein n=1 Tax=Nocardioides sp. TaxID=35761 RepID=UPI002F419C3D
MRTSDRDRLVAGGRPILVGASGRGQVATMLLRPVLVKAKRPHAAASGDNGVRAYADWWSRTTLAVHTVAAVRDARLPRSEHLRWGEA